MWNIGYRDAKVGWMMPSVRDVLRLLVIDDSRKDRWLTIGQKAWWLDTDRATTEDVVDYRVPGVMSMAEIVGASPYSGVTRQELHAAVHDILDEVEQTLDKVEQEVLERAEFFGLSELVPNDFMDEDWSAVS